MAYSSIDSCGNDIGLKRRIDRIYDHLYANAVVRTPAAICVEVAKVLHTGLYVEQVLAQTPGFCFSRGECRALEQGLSKAVAQVSADVRRLFHDMKQHWRIYDESVGIGLTDLDIAYTCSYLSGILISDPRQDVFGEFTEAIRSRWTKQAGGQFFTDQRVTSLAMRLLQYDPRKGDDLVDICAGTGGFLLAGLHRVAELVVDESEPQSALRDLACKSLKGREIDHEVAAIANATLRSRLGSDIPDLIECGDSLDLNALSTAPEGQIRYGSHTCAATNPPFGTKITIKSPRVLDHFDLAGGRSGRARLTTSASLPTSPDILFLEQNVRLLKPGIGRLAIVLPYQILSGPQARYIREWLLTHTSIRAVVDLPPDTFQPHTGTKASLVLVQRRAEPLVDLTLAPTEHVFMSVPVHIGHDRRGNPVYKRDSTGGVTDEILTDLPAVARAFDLFLTEQEPATEHEASFRIQSDDIVRDPLLRINSSFHSGFNRTLAKTRTRDHGTVMLGDVVERIFFPGRFKRNYVKGSANAVPFLGGSNVTELLVSTKKWLHPDDPKVEELRVRSGWILVTRSGSTGIVSSVPKSWDGVAMSEHVIRIVPNEQLMSGEYIHAFLRSPHGQNQIARGIFGSVIDEINPSHLAQIQIPLPASADRMSAIVEEVRS